MASQPPPIKQPPPSPDDTPENIFKPLIISTLFVTIERCIPEEHTVMIRRFLVTLLGGIQRRDRYHPRIGIKVLQTTVLNPELNIRRHDCSIKVGYNEELEAVVVRPGASHIAARQRMMEVMRGERIADLTDAELMYELRRLGECGLSRKQELKKRLRFLHDYEAKMAFTEEEDIEWPVVRALTEMFQDMVTKEDEALGVIAAATGVGRWMYWLAS